MQKARQVKRPYHSVSKHEMPWQAVTARDADLATVELWGESGWPFCFSISPSPPSPKAISISFS